MSEIKALEALRGIAKQMDEVAAMQSEHGFSPWAIKIANELNHLEAEIAERNDDSALESDVSTDGACSNDGEHATADREHSLESESVRERPESAERVTKTPEMLHDTRERLEEDLKTHLYEFGGYCFSSREGHTDNVDTFFDDFVFLLDRQAAITEREFFETACQGCERLGGDGGPTLDELCDELRKYIVKADRLGAALDERDDQLADARESLEAAWDDNAELKAEIATLKEHRAGNMETLRMLTDANAELRKYRDEWKGLAEKYRADSIAAQAETERYRAKLGDVLDAIHEAERAVR